MIVLKRIKCILNSIVLLFICSTSICTAQNYDGFVHPGIMHSEESLKRIEKLVYDKEEPAYGSYIKLSSDPKASYNYQVKGPFPIISRADEYGYTKAPCEDDFNSAYYNALMWIITKDERHALKSLEIIRKYAATLRKITPRDDPLCAGLQGFIIVNAAEIIRYTYPEKEYSSGWNQNDTKLFSTMLTEAFIPVFTKFHNSPAYSNGNWGLSVLKGKIAMAVFLNDKESFDDVIKRYLETGYDNGSLPNYVAETGQLQESGRDQAHCMLGLGCMAEICEVAWIQGIDIYSALDNRLMKGYEYTSKYNLGYDDLPFFTWTDKTGKYCNWTSISDKARGNIRSVFEIAYAHYVSRMGLEMPYTKEILDKSRPEGKAWTCDHPGFGSLLFYQPVKKENYVDLVNPFIDSHKSRWFFFNSACRPFGMVSLSPDTSIKGSWNSGYVYDSLSVKCFSHIHNWQMSGVAVMPTVGQFKGHLGPYAYKSSFSHNSETAKPGYHKLHLDDYNIKVELTSTDRVGFHKYTYPKSDSSYIIFDSGAHLAHSNTLSSCVWKVDDYTIAGWQESAPSGRRPKPIKTYFYAQTNKKIEEVVAWKNNELISLKETRVQGKNSGLAIKFSTKENEEVLLKVSISYTSIANAQLNLNSELPKWDFNEICQESFDVWNEMLGRIDVKGGTKSQKVKFYTDLWHALIGRHSVSDINGQYIDMTSDTPLIRQIPLGQNLKPLYRHFNFDAWWGSHWSLNILWSMVYPEIVDEFCNTMIDYYHNGGLIPRGPSGGNYTYVMIGDPAVSFFATAINCGITNYDLEAAYAGLKKNAFIGGIRDHSGYEHSSDAKSGGMEYYQTIGYVPDNRTNLKGMHNTGASMTLEYAYQDWCLAQIALKMGKKTDYDFFMKRSQNYKNVWNSKIGYMCSRKIDGTFFENFDPLEISEKDGFCESNSAIYSHYVPHDLPGLIHLMGGSASYIKRLNRQFELSEPNGFFRSNNPNMKQYNWTDYGNQPGTGMAHMFSHAGAPWLTQKWVRKVKNAYSDITPYGGYRDDEDQGQMGALGVLMAIGLFQIDGGCSVDSNYEITSPIFDSISISLNNKYYKGETFKIISRNNSDKNIYIQSAELNGCKWDSFVFPSNILFNGGELILNLGNKPNRKWGVKSNQ